MVDFGHLDFLDFLDASDRFWILDASSRFWILDFRP